MNNPDGEVSSLTFFPNFYFLLASAHLHERQSHVCWELTNKFIGIKAKDSTMSRSTNNIKQNKIDIYVSEF
jgi:hypothetical protein